MKCRKCNNKFIEHSGFEIYCPSCIKEEWIKNRGERLERELYTAYEITAPNNNGREYIDYSTKSNEGRFLTITNELFELYEKKNKDYGNAFGDTFEEFGLVSAVIRLNDKMNRLKKLTTTGSQEVKDESVRDTLVDLANYSIMALMEIDKNE